MQEVLVDRETHITGLDELCSKIELLLAENNGRVNLEGGVIGIISYAVINSRVKIVIDFGEEYGYLITPPTKIAKASILVARLPCSGTSFPK